MDERRRRSDVALRCIEMMMMMCIGMYVAFCVVLRYDAMHWVLSER